MNAGTNEQFVITKHFNYMDWLCIDYVIWSLPVCYLKVLHVGMHRSQYHYLLAGLVSCMVKFRNVEEDFALVCNILASNRVRSTIGLI